MRSKKQLSIFMVLLMISLPFYSSLAIAQTTYTTGDIESIRISGENNIHQVTRLGEPGIFFEIRIRESANPEDVFVNGVSADNCEQGNSTSICYLDLPNQGEGRQFYDIRYKSQTQSLPLVTDGTEPTIHSLSLNRLSDGRIQVSFDIEDFAKNTNLCAGLGKIQISESPDFSSLVLDQTIEPQDISDCRIEDTVTFSGPTESGEYTYYIRALDRLGQISEIKEKLFAVDVDIPLIGEPRIARNGEEVQAFAEGTRPYKLEVEITEEGELVEVYANLEDFGLTDREETSCTREPLSTEHFCSWDIDVSVGNGTTEFNLEVTAEDDNSNINSRSRTIQIELDEEAPTVESIETNHGIYLGGEGVNNTIIIEIEDAGGVNEDAIFADLSRISTAYSNTEYADECHAGKCYWYGIRAQSNDGPVNVNVYVEDIFGHSNTDSGELIIDTTAPIITDLRQSPNSPAYPDPLTITVIANDGTNSSGLGEIEADISELSQGSTSVSNICEQEECSFTVDDLMFEARYANLTYMIRDQAGNEANGEHGLQIFETEEDYRGDSVTVRIGDISPELIDRKAASKIPFKVYVPITYNKPDEIIVRDKAVQCNGAADFLDQTEQINPYFVGESLDSNLLVFVLGLDQVTARADRIKFNCTISMFLQEGSVIYENPEIDNFELNFELYNHPGGSLDDAIVDKLQDIEENVNDGFLGLIGELSDLFEILKKVCNIIQTVQQVYSFVENMKPIVYTATRLIPSVGDSIWLGYLKMECYVKAFKDFLWPNDADYAFTGQVNGKAVGVLSAITGGEYIGAGEQPPIGGFVRRVCAFVLCNQCNQGFNLVDAFVPEADGALGNFAHNPLGFLGVDLGGAPRKSPTETQEEYGRRVDRASQDSLEYGSKINLEAHYNPEDSFVVAGMCLCLPGIISNLEKYRQLQCIHAQCISDSAKAGLSTAQCDISHQQRTCVYFTGAVANAIPFYALAKQVTKVINDMIRELPGRLLASARDLGCGDFDEQVTKQAGAFTSVGAQFAQCSTKVEVEFLTTNPQTFICGAIDATMLVWSWDSYIENAFNFDSWSTLFGDDKEVDYCETAFEEIQEEDNEEDDSNAPTSVPLGGGFI